MDPVDKRLNKIETKTEKEKEDLGVEKEVASGLGRQRRK